jgi:hypothetical protein
LAERYQSAYSTVGHERAVLELDVEQRAHGHRLPFLLLLLAFLSGALILGHHHRFRFRLHRRRRRLIRLAAVLLLLPPAGRLVGRRGVGGRHVDSGHARLLVLLGLLCDQLGDHRLLGSGSRGAAHLAGLGLCFFFGGLVEPRRRPALLALGVGAVVGRGAHHLVDRRRRGRQRRWSVPGVVLALLARPLVIFVVVVRLRAGRSVAVLARLMVRLRAAPSLVVVVGLLRLLVHALNRLGLRRRHQHVTALDVALAGAVVVVWWLLEVEVEGVGAEEDVVEEVALADAQLEEARGVEQAQLGPEQGGLVLDAHRPQLRALPNHALHTCATSKTHTHRHDTRKTAHAWALTAQGTRRERERGGGTAYPRR